jgi:hypothetical protein
MVDPQSHGVLIYGIPIVIKAATINKIAALNIFFIQ